MDVTNYTEQLEYAISTHTGPYQSFEREVYDMMRAALVKCSLPGRPSPGHLRVPPAAALAKSSGHAAGLHLRCSAGASVRARFWGVRA
jgi:hypothetical protein